MSSSSTGIPIRADMATTIAGPNGICESEALMGSGTAMSAQTLKRREGLKTMLMTRLQKQHGGGDPVRAALVKFEVERCAALKNSAFSAADLAALEKNVAEAVKAADKTQTREGGGPMTNARGDYHREVDEVANWTKVAMFQADFVNVAHAKQQAEKLKRKEELREQLAHQGFQKKQEKRAAVEAKKADGSEMARLMSMYEQECKDVEDKRTAKLMHYGKERSDQIAERQARRAVTTRLKQLEDQELLDALRKEKEEKDAAAAAQQKVMEEKNRQAMIEFEKARQRKVAEKEAKNVEEARLNAQWKAILDKQEADRAAHVERLKANISKNSREYEDTVGAMEKERDRRDEERRRKYIADHEAAEAADERARQERRLQMMRYQTSIQQQQKAELAERNRAHREEMRLHALEQNKEAVAHEAQIQQSLIDQKAKCVMKQKELGEQIEEKRQAKASAAKMTPLEVSMNRDLLISIMDGDHGRMGILC